MSVELKVIHLPGSGSPKPGGGCADNGPGVLPEPGDLTSSFIAPPYESEELGGLWKNIKANKRLKTRLGAGIQHSINLLPSEGRSDIENIET